MNMSVPPLSYEEQTQLHSIDLYIYFCEDKQYYYKFQASE